MDGDDGALIQEAIFQQDGINWISFTYKCQADIAAEDIVPKDDEIEEARWFTKEDALGNAVSLFDIEAIHRVEEWWARQDLNLGLLVPNQQA